LREFVEEFPEVYEPESEWPRCDSDSNSAEDAYVSLVKDKVVNFDTSPLSHQDPEYAPIPSNDETVAEERPEGVSPRKDGRRDSWLCNVARPGEHLPNIARAKGW